jgi:hypothetical protein
MNSIYNRLLLGAFVAVGTMQFAAAEAIADERSDSRLVAPATLSDDKRTPTSDALPVQSLTYRTGEDGRTVAEPVRWGRRYYGGPYYYGRPSSYGRPYGAYYYPGPRYSRGYYYGPDWGYRYYGTPRYGYYDYPYGGGVRFGGRGFYWR